MNIVLLKICAICAICVICGSLSSCTHTDTYLPAPPTPESERLVLEKQSAWEKVCGVTYKFFHPSQIENDILRMAAKVLPWGHG